MSAARGPQDDARRVQRDQLVPQGKDPQQRGRGLGDLTQIGSVDHLLDGLQLHSEPLAADAEDQQLRHPEPLPNALAESQRFGLATLGAAGDLLGR